MNKEIAALAEKIIAKYTKGAEQAAVQGIIPYTGSGAEWVSSPYDGNGWWTGGFWPGLMWQLYAASGSDLFRQEALRAEQLLTDEFRVFSALNHDVGFMYLLSSDLHNRLCPDKQAEQDTLHAATLLAGRFNPLGFLSAWNGGRPGWAIVDSMMNLSLLYRASELTGDPRFESIAKAHADTCIREFVRENGSCNHIVIFDPKTGEVLDRPGGQGYAPGSSWSRGQAWGLYGFVISYAHTGEKRYLDTAMKIARYFIAHIRPDGLTDCDFCQPVDEERIDNIAGAIAACGLLHLADLPESGSEAPFFREAAMRLISALDTLCADWDPDHMGILTKCTAAYHQDGAGRHINIVYGDYFFTEAVMYLAGTDPAPWFPAK
ncbi:MAG: glycoside hydrolase family 88 protein [Clostridia bacterium]|nr:glycoside hydrolase family 88 protein [Clostridia bacterium]